MSTIATPRLCPYDLVSPAECEVRGDNVRFLSNPEREMVEEHFHTIYISELVTDNLVVFLEPVLLGTQALG